MVQADGVGLAQEVGEVEPHHLVAQVEAGRHRDGGRQRLGGRGGEEAHVAVAGAEDLSGVGVEPGVEHGAVDLAVVDRRPQVAVVVEVGQRRHLAVKTADDLGADRQERGGGAMIGAAGPVGPHATTELGGGQHGHLIGVSPIEGGEERGQAGVELGQAVGVELGVVGVAVEVAHLEMEDPDPEIGVDQPGRHRHLGDELVLGQRRRVERRQLRPDGDGVGGGIAEGVGQVAAAGGHRTEVGHRLELEPFPGVDRADVVHAGVVDRDAGRSTGVALHDEGHVVTERHRVERVGAARQAVGVATEPARRHGPVVRLGGHDARHVFEVTEGARGRVADAFDDGDVALIPMSLHLAEGRVQTTVVGERDRRAGGECQAATPIVVGAVVDGGAQGHAVEATVEGDEDEDAVGRRDGRGRCRHVAHPGGQRRGAGGHRHRLQEAATGQAGAADVEGAAEGVSQHGGGKVDRHRRLLTPAGSRGSTASGG